jgi:hypothetical protein
MATIFEDNFNSYNDGNLNGQGGWSGYAAYKVQGTIVKEGAKAIKFVGTGGYEYITKYGTQFPAGMIGCYIRVNNLNASFRVNFCEGDNQMDFIYLSSDGYLHSYRCGVLGAITIDTWHWIQWEWRTSPDKKIRARVDDGAWTDWFDPWHSWATGPNNFNLLSNAVPKGLEVYFDYIAENPYTPPAVGRSYGYIF